MSIRVEKSSIMNKKLKILLIALAALAVIVAVAVVYLYSNGLLGIHNHSEAQKGRIKVACVGDSITYGHGVNPSKDGAEAIARLVADKIKN